MDNIQERILRQAEAMGSEVFEVGLYKPAPAGAVRFPEMLLRTWDVEMVIRSISWLKSQNAKRRILHPSQGGAFPELGR